MSEARTAADSAPAGVVSLLREAAFVRLVATQTGDSLAAAGLVAEALRASSIPFKIETISPDSPGHINVDAGPADAVCVSVGTDETTADTSISGYPQPASSTAFAVAREFDGEPDPVLALAGVVAAGSMLGTDSSGAALAAAKDCERVSRHPGVAFPTPAWGRDLCSSTLLRVPASGDPESAERLLDEFALGEVVDPENGDPAGADNHSDDDRRRLASALAVEVTRCEVVSDRGAAAVERVLRPYVTDEPFASVGGYADILSALALEAPGQGLALMLATDPQPARKQALDIWRSHGRAAHRGLDEATIGRYDGATVFRVSAASTTLPTIARLARDFQSPEPAVIALTDESESDPDYTDAVVITTEPREIGDVTASAAAETGGVGGGTAMRGRARIQGDKTEFVAAVRERL